MSEGDDAEGAIPSSARLLAYAGLLPFAAGVLALWTGTTLPIADALIAYGAVILSFMGAVHWGLGLSAGAAAERDYRFGVSVVPALLGWAALLLALAEQPLPGLALLIVGFIGVYRLDLGAVRRGLAPDWYRPLRLQLSAAVVALLALAAAALYQTLY